MNRLQRGNNINIYDVSGKAKVSIAIVSKALNRNPNASKKTRSRVLSVVKELGYTPNVFTRGLGLGAMKAIGIMCSDSSDPCLVSTIYCLERELRANGYGSIFYCTGNSLDTKQKYFNLLLSKQVDAIILTDSKLVELKPKDNAYILGAAKDLSIILVNGYLDGPNIYSMTCDDRVVMYQAMESLIATGHDDILYLYTSHSYSSQSKMQGYKDIPATHHIPVSEELVHQCSKDVMASRELLLQLWDLGLRLNEVMISGDSLAADAVKFANQKGTRIPGECSIIGYNNSVLSPCMDPELASVDTKVESLCITTINTLMGVLGGGNIPSRTTVVADFIKKQTTENE